MELRTAGEKQSDKGWEEAIQGVGGQVVAYRGVGSHLKGRRALSGEVTLELNFKREEKFI